MNISLQGKTAVVCGSTQGIGLAIAKELALLGANCILMARNADTLQLAIEQLSKTGTQQHRFAVADFSKPDTVQQAIRNIISSGTVHILVNNTGGPAAGTILEASTEDFEAAFRQHVVCNQLLAQTVVPGMKEAGFGRIINIISTSVKVPLPGLGVSNTVRGAVASWAKTLSNELATFGITVNNVLPGYTQTQRLESLLQSNARKKGISEEEAVEDMKKEVPMQRIADASEIAAVAAFLASPAASYVTGISIPVDGGRVGCI